MIDKCEKGKLVMELCKLMGWEKERCWKIWSQPLRIKDVEELIKKLKDK